MYAVVHRYPANRTLTLNKRTNDGDFNLFVKEYLAYKRGYQSNFQDFFQNISKSPEWPFLNDQSVPIKTGYNTDGGNKYRYEQRLELVKMHFETRTYEMITRDTRTDIPTQISLIGGTLGLFLGFSFISALEIIYFIIKFLCRCTRSKQLRMNKINANMQKNQKHECM